MVYNHSIKVPTQYKKAAAIFKQAIEEGKSVKSLVFAAKHARIPNLLALFAKYSDNRDTIEKLIEETSILTDNSRLNPYMCRVLITELLYGTKSLKGESSKPVQCVLSYKEKLLPKVLATNVTKKSREHDPRYVRINTNLIKPEDVYQTLSEEGWKFKEKPFASYDEYLQAIKDLADDEYIGDMHVANLLVFPGKWRNYLARHEFTNEKKFLLQDKATCLAAEFLKPEPGSIVLDMCAAPGMKTIHLSNLLGKKGKIYAVEQNESRFDVLCEMVSSAKALNVETINQDVLTIRTGKVMEAEYILVDPPCSGSGMQKRISLKKEDEEKDEERIRKLQVLQCKILSHAMTNFPNAKRIVYSTCSLYEEENEKVVQSCLKWCPGFKLLNGKKIMNRHWKNTGNTDYKGIGKNCIYSLPDYDLTEGIFLSVFEREKTRDNE